MESSSVKLTNELSDNSLMKVYSISFGGVASIYKENFFCSVNSQSITTLISRLWCHIGSRRRYQFGMLLAVMLVASFAEIISIGAVFPFLAVLTAPEQIYSNPSAQQIIKALGLTEPAQIIMPLTVGFCAATLIAGAMRLLLLWATTRLSFSAGAEVSTDIYRRTLYQPYAVQCMRNSSQVISGITSKASNLTHNIIVPCLSLISASVMLVAVLSALLSMEPLITLWTFGGFGLIYVSVVGLTRRRLERNSQCVSFESTQIVKSLQEGLGGIRDVLIDGSQEIYCQVYTASDSSLRRAQGDSAFIGSSPRYAMETLGIVMIAGMAYWNTGRTDGVGGSIPILGALAIGAQRLLPVLQQAYGSWASIRSGQASLQDTLELLDQPLPEHILKPNSKDLAFECEISLNQVAFRYVPETSLVLKGIDLVIKKGIRIGFVGATGSGKSTLIDLVMGLLEPTCGSIYVDGQPLNPSNSHAWQTHIAHVPQSIFLSDSSIAENIAFGVPKKEIDYIRVREAAQQAQISSTIDALPEKYQTIVGERGIRLSGGQRQRIGIARALYKQADVIVFDEATSALDTETEEAVMRSIDALSHSITLIIVAHRITTLKGCSQIVELSDGGINFIGSYQELVNQINIPI